ncbi:DUF3987 domain-containing protein [Streptosporangium sp. NPDC020145]|uniref:YfjI family protein n=1 Tax=Streptosporangium sp. NPDC020145 TaxID=3154694 RepID=UPI00342DE748
MSTSAGRLRVIHPGDGDGGEWAQPLPHNIEAEQCVLGAAMLSPTALAAIRPLLEPGVFHRPAHARIWETITALADQGAPTDPLAVGAALGRDLAAVGGAPYLHTLIAMVPTAVNAPYYAHLLRGLAYARQVIAAGTRLVQLGHDTTTAHTEAAQLRAAVTAELATLTAVDEQGWSEPTPLSAVREAAAFPVWALPSWLGEYAGAVAEVTQTPPDLAGCLALAVLAVAAAGRVWVQAPAWREPTNLYVVVVLPPGNRKSEVYALMTAPVRIAENHLAEAARPLIVEAELTRKIAEAEADKTARIAANADPDRQTEALAEASSAAMALDGLTVPAEPKLFTANATVERLTSLLAEQGGRFAVLAPEGKIFSILAGRYSGSPDLEVFLSGHAGEEMRIDRMGRPSERIESTTLTLGVCVQPGVLARLGDTPEFREQGLLGRLLYALPTSLLGYRKENPDPIPAQAAQRYATNLTALLLSLHDLTEPVTLHFDAEAAEAITRLLADTEVRFRPGGDLHHMTDWGGKLVGATIRIAALLHLAKHLRDGWQRPIDLDTFAAACEIGEYFTSHAQTAYDHIGADPAVADARALLDWAGRTGTTRFTAREVLPAMRSRFAKVADLDPALRVLEAHGWIRRLPTAPQTGRGRPASPAYEVHPSATA